MKEKLGEVFYNGELVNLDTVEINKLDDIYLNFKKEQAESKERLMGCLEKMRNL